MSEAGHDGGHLFSLLYEGLCEIVRAYQMLDPASDASFAMLYKVFSSLWVFVAPGE